jgi:hypothetical protein
VKLEYLHITAMVSYEAGFREGAYKGKIHYTGQHGEITVNLTPEISEKILRVVAADMVVASKELATNLTSETITQAALPPVERVAGPTQNLIDDIPF